MLGHKENDKNCLKCEYNELVKEGKAIIDAWDKKPPPPAKLVKVQEQLAVLKNEILEYTENKELEFCAKHPEIFQFLPVEIL